MFVGESLDEMVGEVHGEEAMEYHRRLQEAFAEEYPRTNMALRMAGGVTSTIPMGAYAGTAKLYKWLQSLPNLYKYGGGMSAGGLFGMTEGFVSGSGIQGEGETGGARAARRRPRSLRRRPARVETESSAYSAPATFFGPRPAV